MMEMAQDAKSKRDYRKVGWASRKSFESWPDDLPEAAQLP